MPKRGENIYKRKDGRWEGRYIKNRSSGGRAIYGYLYGKTYSEVKSKLKLKEISKEENENKDKKPFYIIVNSWLDNRKLKVKESTYAHYATVIQNHILPAFGEIPVSNFDNTCVENYILQLSCRGFSPKTINDILTIIKNILKFALANGVEIKCNLSSIVVKNKTAEISVLSECQQSCLSKYLIDNLDYRNFGILLSLYTGVRIGELCALKWSDIDLNEKTLKINKTMLRISDKSDSSSKTKIIVTPPKTDESNRIIPIPDFIFLYIKRLKCKSDAYILTNSKDKFIEPRAMQYHFKKVLKESNIEYVNFHTLRHTFATRCVECGFDVKTLSEILGHSNVKITLDRYVHCSMQLKRKNMEKLNFLSA